MIKIDKQVPVPEHRRPRKYPFKEMEVGDSFFVPYGETNPLNVTNSVSASCKAGRLKDKKFTVRNIKGEHGCRCWRIG